MTRIILILIIIWIILFAVYKIKNIQIEKQKQLIKTLFIVAVISILGGLALSGHLNWLVAVIGAIVSVLPRMFAWGARFLPGILVLVKNLRTVQAARNSQIVTAFLRVTINRSTGDIQGQVIQGRLINRELSTLSINELKDLLKIVQQEDADSAGLLMAFLDQKHQGWRKEGSYKQQEYKSGAMTVAEARDILAVEEGASRQDIIKAHKKLIQKLHPDRGGTNYLAGKINQARDVLLS